jgi:RNA polymerase sigma factor (TIGR02999 family)
MATPSNLPPDVDSDDLDILMADLYQKLRLLARGQRRRSAGPLATLDTTAIVHEAYVRLARTRGAFIDGEHFLATATRTMRNLLIDHARKRLADKRGGGEVADELTGNEPGDPTMTEKVEQLLDLDRALAELAEEEPRLVAIIEARFFAGLTEKQTAAGLELSERTVRREWIRAREWLEKRLGGSSSG